MNAESLLRLSGVKQCSKGTVVLQEGAAGGDMFVLLQGSVGVFRNYQKANEIQTATLAPICFFGENGLFLGQKSPSTFVAVTDTVLLAVNKQNLGETFGSQPEIASLILETLCKRVAALTAKVGEGAEQGYSRGSKLFPKAHGTYLLPLGNEDRNYLCEQNMTCPVCGKDFPSMTVLTSRLRLERTDPDLRTRYRDIEPMYYEVVTCPHCLYSALTDMFPEGSRGMRQNVDAAVGSYRADVVIKPGKERDTFTVFAGYYLAIYCAPTCFDDYQLTTAKLWLRLSRLYKDCEDETMYLFATEQALNEYKYAYEHFRLSEKVMQQMCYIIGDLYSKLGDLNNARNSFFLAKSNKAGTTVMTRQADVRLDEIRELIQQQKGSGG